MIEGRRDPRTRTFLPPTRLVWSSNAGVENPQSLLNDDRSVCILSPAAGPEPPGIVLDFGRERHGGVCLDIPTTSTGRPARIRVRFGESVSEAMGTPNNDHTIHDFDTFAAWMGRTEIGSTGFRFVRIDLLDTETALHLRWIEAVSLMHPLEYQGTFTCSDARLNRIWEVGAYTVHLCMQDHVWDGIKRDRLVWIGDLHPEAMVIASIFGAHPIVPATLDYERDRTPLPGWMNGISSYSLWWLLIQRDWFRYHADLHYLKQQREYLLGLLNLLMAKVDNEGRESLDGFRFLEWPTSRDPTAIDAGLQALVVMALQAGAELCTTLGETQTATEVEEIARRAARCIRPPSPSKQANALAVLAGMAEANTINTDILALDPNRSLSTFYGYYILQARATAGDYAGCLDLIRTYWGGMLDMGATSFWEGFEIDWMENATPIDALPEPGKRDIHADFGDYCYPGLRHSLCHGWAAGPTAWLMEHVLGIAPASPGFETVTIRPHLEGLDYARGTFPTPHGLIHVSHERQPDGSVATTVQLPPGVARSAE
jgi:alpha-L-rhamnosidase